MIPDPQLYLEYAEALLNSGEPQRARQIVYTLIANEYYYTGPIDHEGNARGEDQVEEHKKIIRHAQILLGSMYADSLDVVAEVGS